MYLINLYVDLNENDLSYEKNIILHFRFSIFFI